MPPTPAPPATSRADDRLIIRRAVRRLWICLAVAVAAFVGPALVPTAWKAPFHAFQPVTVPYANTNPALPRKAAVVIIGLSHTAIAGIVTSVTIRLEVRPLDEPRERVSDEATIAAVRAAFIEANSQSLGAEAGPLVDRARASPGEWTEIWYGWRTVCASVLILLALGFFAALIVAFYATRALIAAKRRGRLGLCTQCGYDLQGLSSQSPCPECGSVQTVAAAG